MRRKSDVSFFQHLLLLQIKSPQLRNEDTTSKMGVRVGESEWEEVC